MTDIIFLVELFGSNQNKFEILQQWREEWVIVV